MEKIKEFFEDTEKEENEDEEEDSEENVDEDNGDSGDDEMDWNNAKTIEKAFDMQIKWLDRKGLPPSYLTFHNIGDNEFISRHMNNSEILNFMDKKGYKILNKDLTKEVWVFKFKEAT